MTTRETLEILNADSLKIAVQAADALEAGFGLAEAIRGLKIGLDIERRKHHSSACMFTMIGTATVLAVLVIREAEKAESKEVVDGG